MTSPSLPVFAVRSGRIAELVADIEQSQRRDIAICRMMDQCEPGTDAYGALIELALENDEAIDEARSALRELIAIDPYRLAAAMGSGS